MEKYQSKEILAEQPAREAYERFSRLDALTPIVEGKVERWQADADSCSFTAMGFPLKLRVGERVPGRMVSVVPDGGAPVDFRFIVAFGEVSGTRCSVQFSMEVEMNMMLRMMIGSKLQDGLDKMADAAALYLNGH